MARTTKRVLSSGRSTTGRSVSAWKDSSYGCWAAGPQHCVKDEPITSAGASLKSNVSASTAIQTPGWDDEPEEEGEACACDHYTDNGDYMPKMEASTTMPDHINVEPQQTWDALECEDFWDGFKSLWGNQSTSDVMLCPNDVYPAVHAHWIFLNMRTSAFFDLKSGKNYKGKDIVSTNLDGRTLRRVVQYIYEGDYDVPDVDENPEEDIFEAHADVYKAAQMYQIRGLTKVCVEKFRDICTDNWDCDSFCKAAEIVYSVVTSGDSTKDVMKEGVLEEAIIHGLELRDYPHFKALLNDKDKAIAGDLVLQLLPKNHVDDWPSDDTWGL
ncbi:hypothetical protein Plec18167_007855 [Paecilomyces lecythidis]|uniref:BTB domain-containing protein n=1 Tax=Paecilomyces lecythidis TaxID=3004212 RepID=A0ABR3X1F9_9EURO